MDTNLESIKAAIQASIPVMLVGAPGTGKTATIQKLARDMDYKLITIVGSRLDPTDVSGLPKAEKMYEKSDGSPVYGTVYLSPWWQITTLKEKKVILFFDEFSNTPPSVRASLLTLLQSREFANGEKMPEETVMIAAMNASDQAADGYELDLPTTNRFFFIDWKPGNMSWYEGMLNAWGEKVSDEEMMWRSKIVSFLKDNPSFIHKEPHDASSVDVYGLDSRDSNQMEVFRSAWASQRSWDKLSQALPFAGERTQVQDKLIQGLVGFSASSRFREWLQKNDNINPMKVMESPESFNWKSMSLNDTNLVLRSLVDMVDETNSEKIINVFECVADAGRVDAGAPFIKELLKNLTSSKLPKPVVDANRGRALKLVKKYKTLTKKN